MKYILRIILTLFISILFTSFCVGQNKINDQLSKNSQKKLHYYLKDLVIENAKFNKSAKTEKEKQNYQELLISYSNTISLIPDKSNSIVNSLIKVKKGTNLKNSSILFNQYYHTSPKYDFITASIKINDLELLVQDTNVLYVEPSFIIEPQLQWSVNDIHAPDVWDGYCNINDKIDGTGVIIGILDTKLNRDHITFQDANGQTRILNYNEIGDNPESHGTHVASIAAGRGDAAGNWRGVAYNSNIYWKSTGTTNEILNNFQWMIDQSGTIPLVTNLSAGFELGPHDGTTEFETLLNSKISGNKIFVNSCGNNKSNAYNIHYQSELPQSSTLSFAVNLDPDPLPSHTGEDYSNNEFKVEIWYDGDYSIDVKIREPEGDWSDWVNFGNSLDYDFPGDGKVHIYNDGTCYGPGQNYGNGDHVIYFDFYDPWPGDHIIKTGNYIIQLRDHDNNNSGNCKVDTYNTLECIDYNNENIDAVSFIGGDYYQSITSPSYASKVISVAACQKEYYGGDISSYSSVGPARNDVSSISKPDITAPGGDSPPDVAMIIAANYQSDTLFNMGMAGTSQAAPHVTGAIALLLQNFSDLTALEIKDILQISSGALPNGHSYGNGTITNEEMKFWGSGKLNIFEAYKYMVGYISQSEYDQAFQDAFQNHPYLTGLPVEKVDTNWFLHNKQRLTNGAIFLRANTSTAYWLGEEIWNAWESMGHIYSGLGLPISTEYRDATNNNYETVDFQFGQIYWDGNNTVLVPNYTEAGGTISQNITWSGTIRVLNDVTVDNGYTLTITPGTQVMFNEGKRLTINGRLYAVGNASDSITFSTYDTTGFYDMDIENGGWGGIILLSNPPDSSIISFSILKYGKNPNGQSNKGGAISLGNSIRKVRISNSDLSYNKTSYFGGAIFAGDGGYILIKRNYFSHNNCSLNYPGSVMGGWGGGYFYGNTLENNQGTCLWTCCEGYNIVNNTFINNGNAIWSESTGGVWSIIGNIIHNSGGITIMGGVVNSINNNTITNSNGAGIYAETFNKISNNILCNNNTGISLYQLDYGGDGAVIINNIICNNLHGINIYESCNGIFKNNIIYGNQSYQVRIGQLDYEWCGNFTFENNNIEGGYENIVFITSINNLIYQNNINSAPLFVNPTAGAGTSYDASQADWHLQSTSPCIDMGTFENAPRQDLDGKYRNGSVDIGAYEYNGITPTNEGFWLGNSNTTWNNSGNWYNNSIPNCSTNVVVTAAGNQPVISSNSNCNNLTLHAQANLNIETGNNLHVFGNIEINSDRGGSGSVIDNNNLTIDGTKTIERYIPKYVGAAGWHFLSSPLSNQPIRPEFVPNGNPIPGANDFYKWDETSNLWINTKDDNGNWNTSFEDNFVKGNGYLVAYDNDVTKSFTQGNLNTGDMNTGDELPALTYTTGQGEGWNLLGNPYPSAIDWDLCQRTAGIDASVYVYDGDAGQYVSWNGTTGSLNDGVIPVMQGFFVKVNSAGQTLTIPNSSRIHSSINFYKNKTVVENLLVLQITGNSFSDKTYINFNNNATHNFDNQYDAYKLFGINEAPQLYSILPDKKLSINVFPYPTNDIIIPLGLKVGEDTEYTIKAIESNFSDTLDIILEDLKENYSINLDNSDYTFYATINDNPNRFKLHFNVSTGIQELINNDYFIVYPENNKIHIISNSNNYQNSHVQVINILGQLVIPNTKLNDKHTIIDAKNNKGILIVRIIKNNQSVNKKIFIK